ncbi:hypothetical protein C882_2693 [Caenispirillum salinarum AK4]|uniref:DUF4112 domain-containing protein n=1 Tax=Caenispirillum salinarum AK4 TaxID=1238182 RepID=K9H6D4_9PROT|nr:DUF4112 domain-containing protein [Caenispirillum salinarum]EKV32614.1 hypothetical protein C882_2693 [Caenispirillum salinarum AK4]
MAQTQPFRSSATHDTVAAAERDRRIKRLQTLGYWLDDRFRVPGLGLRIGLDGILGFIPGIGDTATLALSAWIVAEGWRLGVPKRTLGRMAAEVGADYAIGLVPLVGDLIDVGFKANRRNVRRILRHVGAEVGPEDLPYGRIP